MTRAIMRDAIIQSLRDYQIPVDDEVVQSVVDSTIDCTLQYVMKYSLDVSEQLMRDGLHSEAMVAGTIITKLKRLLGE